MKLSKVFVVSKKQVRLFVYVALAVIVAAFYLRYEQARAVNATEQVEQIFHLVTGEFKTTTADGKELEAYRWDPGTIVVRKGESVELNITGVNGASHPFVIEGLGVRGEVTKGNTTTVRFKVDKKGTYPIRCLTHADIHSNGPMVGYIVVL